MSVVPVDPACLRRPRSNAGSYKPTAQRIQKSVNCLKKEVCALEREVTDLQNAQTSSIAMALSSDILAFPDSTVTLVEGWSVLNATNAFSSGDVASNIFTVPTTGVFHVTANLAWAGEAGASSLRRTEIRHTDGMTVTTYPGSFGSVPNNDSTSIAFAPISASSGDMIYIRGQQDSGSTLTLNATGSSWTIVQYN